MPRHPFFGIIDVEPRQAMGSADSHDSTAAPAGSPTESESCGRRGFFGQAMAAAFAVSAAATASAKGQETMSRPGGGQVTTQALGEEGGAPPNGPGGGTVTTYALGEEGGAYPRPPSQPPSQPGPVTTYALGEEGGSHPRPNPPRQPPGGTVTTYAVGEEAGNGGRYPRSWYYFRRPRYYYYYRG